MKNNYVIWLKEFFSEKLSMELAESAVNDDYFEKGWVDSFGILDLVATVEQNFNIKFNAAHFEDPRFRTILGLAEIIGEIQAS